MSTILALAFDAVMALPWRRFLSDQKQPRAAQERSLKRILRNNGDTDFGKNNGFARLAKLSGRELWREFRQTVPVATYEDFAADIEAMKNGKQNVLIPGRPDMFSLTSGTTSAPKFCPINRAFIKEHHRQHLLWMYKAFRDHRRINSGQYLVMASPAVMGKTAAGIPYGAMSGKQLEVQSIPVRRRMAAPPEIQSLPDSERRWFNSILFALAAPSLRVVTAVNPSTLLVIAGKLGENAEELIDRLAKGRPWLTDGDDAETAKRIGSALKPQSARAARLREVLRADGVLTPSSVWPDLEMIFTWQGGSSSFYLPLVAAFWGQASQRCLGLRASEGTFSIPLRDNEPSGALAVGGHMMEFIPAEVEEPGRNPQTLLADQLEAGKLYRLVVTTSGGFYRYDLGDLVEVTGFYRKTPEVAFVRRAGAVLSATGEKVTESQVVDAMRAAGERYILLNGFTVTWEMDQGVRYVLAVECAGGEKVFFQRRNMITEQLRLMLASFDEELRDRNVEYSAKRDDGRIGPPRLLLLADNTYRDYRAARAKAGSPEIQVKNPHIVTPPAGGRAPVRGCDFFDQVRIVAEIE